MNYVSNFNSNVVIVSISYRFCMIIFLFLEQESRLGFQRTRNGNSKQFLSSRFSQVDVKRHFFAPTPAPGCKNEKWVRNQRWVCYTHLTHPVYAYVDIYNVEYLKRPHQGHRHDY